MMNTQTRFLANATCAALLASLFTLSPAIADDGSMTVGSETPQRATLLPVVRVTADAGKPDREANWQVADASPLRVTLLPTVRVTANARALAISTLPTVHVVAQAEPALVEHPDFVSLTAMASNAASHRVIAEEIDAEPVLLSPMRNLHVTR
jgi:hypothetical protein